MLETIMGNPILAGLAAVVCIYIIFKLIGVVTFLFRMGLALAIAAGLFYYYVLK